MDSILVSILVFVEVALGPSWAGPPSLTQSGFNPCFRGSRPRTQASSLSASPFWGFNPCFRGSRPRTHTVASLSKIGDEVSILVFVEVALGLGIRYLSAHRSVLFQSLFSWKSPSDSVVLSLFHLFTLCFNPCFCGSRPRTISLTSSEPSIRSFNPCFRGSRPRTLICHATGVRHGVSILVFVEVALGPLDGAFTELTMACFNPCFRGSRPRTSYSGVPHHGY